MRGCSEELLALYVEGDLLPAESASVEDHLAICASCRAFVSGLRESQSAFKSLRVEPVSAAALGEVRRRVMSGLAGTAAAPGWILSFERVLFGVRRRYALAGLAAVIVLSGVMWRLMRPVETLEVAPQPTAQVAPMTPPPAPSVVAAPIPEPPPPAPRAPKRRLAPKPAPAPAPEFAAAPDAPSIVAPVEPKEDPPQIVVKLLTDDPNIVIYWLLDAPDGGAE